MITHSTYIHNTRQLIPVHHYMYYTKTKCDSQRYKTACNSSLSLFTQWYFPSCAPSLQNIFPALPPITMNAPPHHLNFPSHLPVFFLLPTRKLVLLAGRSAISGRGKKGGSGRQGWMAWKCKWRRIDREGKEKGKKNKQHRNETNDY